MSSRFITVQFNGLYARRCLGYGSKHIRFMCSVSIESSRYLKSATTSDLERNVAGWPDTTNVASRLTLWPLSTHRVGTEAQRMRFASCRWTFKRANRNLALALQTVDDQSSELIPFLTIRNFYQRVRSELTILNSLTIDLQANGNLVYHLQLIQQSNDFDGSCSNKLHVSRH